MPDEATTTAPTNFAEYEAGGGTYKPAPEQPAPVEAVEAVEKPPAEEAAEPEPAEEQAQPEKPLPGTTQPPKKKLSLNEDIAAKVKQLTEMRREVRELEAKKRDLTPEAPRAAAAPAAVPAKPADDDPPPELPDISTFQGSLPEWEAENKKKLREREEWLLRQSDKRHEQREAERQAKAEQQKISEAYGQQLAEHVKQHPEYVEEIGQTTMSELMANMVLHHGPALGQQLIDNKEEAKRITQLPRDIQIFEMGRLYAQTAQNGNGAHAASEPEPEPVKIPAKLGATGSSSRLDLPTLGAKNYAEYEAAVARLAAKKRAR